MEQFNNETIVVMLENLFGSRTRVKLLKLFLLSEGRFFVREIARLTGEEINSVRRELKNLVEFGLVKEVSAEVGRTAKDESKKFYEVDVNFVLYEELKNLFLKTRLLVERVFIKNIKRLGNVKLLVLAGFFVNDEEAKTDLLIAGQINKRALANFINKISHEFNQPIRYTIMSSAEFNYRHKITDKFLFEILEGIKIIVVNNLEK
jgi:DNA-binding transcriptional ArsR family regulator